MTRLNVAGLGFALLAAAVGVGCWRAGLPPLAAVGAGLAAGACGAAARSLGALAFFAAWAVLVGPLAWLLASAISDG